MKTKLTLRLDTRLIGRAKTHAQKTGRSVSQLVGDYFAVLAGQVKSEGKLPPITKSLHGALKNGRVGLKDYRMYLEKKYK